MSSPTTSIPGQHLKSSLCFYLHIAASGISRVASLSLSLLVQCQGLTYGTVHCLSKRVFISSLESLEDLILCWLFGPFPEFSVADDLRL